MLLIEAVWFHAYLNFWKKCKKIYRKVDKNDPDRKQMNKFTSLKRRKRYWNIISCMVSKYHAQGIQTLLPQTRAHAHAYARTHTYIYIFISTCRHVTTRCPMPRKEAKVWKCHDFVCHNHEHPSPECPICCWPITDWKHFLNFFFFF